MKWPAAVVNQHDKRYSSENLCNGSSISKSMMAESVTHNSLPVPKVITVLIVNRETLSSGG